MNVQRVKNNLEPYMNPRNTASGSLKLQDSKEVTKRPLQCFYIKLFLKMTIQKLNMKI